MMIITNCFTESTAEFGKNCLTHQILKDPNFLILTICFHNLKQISLYTLFNVLKAYEEMKHC